MNCLEHLSLQTANHDSFEVIVVDNTPAEHRKEEDWIVYGATKSLIEDEVGLSAARNCGIRNSTGDVVSFIDDDAEVCPEWVQKVLDSFKQFESALVIGGRVIPKYPDNDRPLWVSKKCEELLSCIDWTDQPRRLRSHEWVVGANISIRREVFDKFGLFNTNLGRKGGSSLLSNDETELFSKFPPNSTVYQPEAWCYHIIPKERLLQSWFRKRVFYQAISDLSSGFLDSELIKYYQEQFIEGLAENRAGSRGTKALYAECETGEALDHQLNQIYKLTIAMSAGFSDIS